MTQMGERNHTIDTLRVLAVIMVIGIHTAGQYVLDNPLFDSSYWVAATIEAIVQVGVPLFVMISGAFILSKLDSWQEHYHKRLGRLLWPLIVWLPAYWIWMWIKGDDVVSYLHGFWQGRAFLHLWYLVMLLGLYLIAPFMNEAIQRVKKRYPIKSQRILWGFTIFLFAIGALARFYDEYFDYQRFFPYLAFDFTGYFLAGYLFVSKPIRKLSPWIILYIVATTFTFVAAYYAKQMANSYYFYNNLAPGILFASVSLFALFSSQRFKAMPANRVSKLQAHVMGIYLIHIAILNIVTKAVSIWAPSIMDRAELSIPIRMIFVFFISLSLVKLLKKIPLSKYIL